MPIDSIYISHAKIFFIRNEKDRKTFWVLFQNFFYPLSYNGRLVIGHFRGSSKSEITLISIGKKRKYETAVKYPQS